MRTIPTKSAIGEPVWEIGELLPRQGEWSEKAYLELSTNRLAEFDNGMIEVLPVPTLNHQLIAAFIYDLLKTFVIKSALGGKALFAPYRIRVAPGKYREPDVLYLSPDQIARAAQEFTDHAELVVEVVSPDDPERDHVTKRAEYAHLGISEYWIVDHFEKNVTVLRLENSAYVEHGRFTIGQNVTSYRFAGLAVAVEDVFNACL